MDKKILVTKALGDTEFFSIAKLKRSMSHTGAPGKLINQVIDRIQNKIKKNTDTTQIYKLAFDNLKKVDKAYAARYGLKKAIMQLGPDGFPFEKYFAKLLESKGYNTATNVIVQGGCITHEVDIIAEKPQEGIYAIIEAKFHSRSGNKTDSKDAMYTYGRFADIKMGWEQKKVKGAKPAKAFLQSWLVTNTEITDNARHYCECFGIKAIGWSWPNNKESLQAMITHTGLYPVTAILTLNERQKISLIKSGAVMCKELVEDPRLLQGLKLSQGQSAVVLDEIDKLCDPV